MLLLVGVLLLSSFGSVNAQGETPASHQRFTTGLTPFSMQEKAVDANGNWAASTNLVKDPSFETAHPNPYWIEDDNIFETPLCIGESDCGYWTNARPHNGSGWAWFGGAGTDTSYHTASLAQTLTFPACGSASLQFYFWIGYSFSGGTDDQFFVKVDGSTRFTANATQAGSYANYKLVTLDVGRFADGKAHTIEFSHINQYSDVGFHLDDVSLVSNAASCVSISGNADRYGMRLGYTIGSNHFEANTDGNGNYSFKVPLHWSGAVVPSGPEGAETFVPSSRTYSNLTTNQTGQNYKIHYWVSGNAGLGGVTLRYTDGTPKAVTSRSDGTYSLLVRKGWSGTVTPSKSGYRFSPANRSYSSLFYPQYFQDYTAIPLYTISGNLGVGGVTLSYEENGSKTVTSQADGSYSLTVPESWTGIVTPTHLCFTFEPTEYSYTSLGTDQTGQDFAASFDTGAGCSDVGLEIGGAPQGRFGLTSGESTRAGFASVNAGPVKIESTNMLPLIAAERLIYKVSGVNTSFSEMMALPDKQLDKVYWLPWYNNNGRDLDTQLRLANVTGQDATVHIFIGENEMTPAEGMPLLAGESTRVSYSGVNDGPVQIVSDQEIVAAERLIYKVNNLAVSFSEMLALPQGQVDKIYWLPWYNNGKDLDTQLRVANVSEQDATVRLYLGTQELSTCTPSPAMPYPFELAAGKSMRVSCAGVNAGPLRIESTQDIVAAERLIYKVGGVAVSFTETMALPNKQVEQEYWLPWYNNNGKDLDTQLRIANTTGLDATVHIFIGEDEMTPVEGMPLLAGESTRISFPTTNAGPVQIVSDQDIVVAERLIYKVNNVNTSFSEMMALPQGQLDTLYWLPWYNNNGRDLDTQLRFGVP
jgi:hypothetical protein